MRHLLSSGWGPFLFFCSFLLFLGGGAAQAAPLIQDRAPDITFGLFMGVTLAATMYLFFIWFVLRERGQIFLILLLLFLGLSVAGANEPLMAFFGFRDETMLTLLQNYSTILTYIFCLLFTAQFLELETTAPFLRFPLYAVILVLVLLLLGSIVSPFYASLALPPICAFSLIVVLLAGLCALWRGVGGSVNHVAAFMFFLVAGMAGPLYDLGYVQTEGASKNIAYACFATATMIFAIVVAGQFAAKQEEKERALQISNERFSLAVRGSNEGLFDWNVRTGEVYFSEQFRRILGVTIESNRRGLREWAKMMQMPDRLAVFRAFKKFIKESAATSLSVEYRISRPSASWRWVHTKVIATRDANSGKVMRFVGSMGDITQKKRGEVELRASEARFRSITEAHPVPVMIVKLQDNTVLYASPGAETLFGMPGGFLVTHKLDRFLPKPAERRDIFLAMTSGQSVNMKEVTVVRADGESLPAALSARRINYQGEAAMVIGLYDLTERKQAERRIAEQQDALQQSEKMAALGGLLAGVAHELNNPLSVIMGQTSLLMEGPAEDKIVQRAGKIFKAADRCSRIVKSFLALARRKPPEHKPVDLNLVIAGSLDLLGYQFRNENVRLDLKLTEGLPSILGDEAQMTQVMTNLALNAAQAMHDWQGPHDLTIATDVDEEGQVRVVVRDTGPGIEPSMRAKVFEPFFTTKAANGGTGVGLSLCHNIVEGHGGRIQIEETQGGGATFVITLPPARAAADVQESGLVEAMERMPSLRILLVDDEVELAQTLADLLEPLGHETDLAANGAIALEKVEKKGFDLIVSDLRMPVMDGPALYEALAAKHPEYTKKIIYVTGDTLSPNVHDFLSRTPVPVIEKPYRLADVQGAIAKLLKEAPAQSNIAGADSIPPARPA